MKLFQARAYGGARPDELVVNEDAPVVQVVQLIITQALRDRASDIHIEPHDDRVRVRFRIDGALHDAARPARRDRAGGGQPDQDPGRA